MKIIITIGEFKVEISDTSNDYAIYNMTTDIKQIIKSVVQDYISIPKID
jgi:hypothetical protein